MPNTPIQFHHTMPNPALTERPVHEQHFQTHDGVKLFYRHWPATGQRRGEGERLSERAPCRGF